MSLKLFSDEEWAAIRRDFDDLGYLHSSVAEYEGAKNAGAYTGCLEVSQDIAPIQKIEGEKRIV